MNDTILKVPAFKLKGRLYTLTVLQLLSADILHIEQQLADVVATAPRLFERTPVVLDCAHIHGHMLDLPAVHQCLLAKGLLVMAIQGGSPALEDNAQDLGLAILKASAAQDRSIELEPVADVQRSKLITTQVRSGQQWVSKGGDLVIAASVSHGAELLSDGNIHVYGALRGRALAGIAGDRNARIFCQSLDAELVSIAGFYRLSDAFEPMPMPCQIYLQDERIAIEPL